MRLILSVVVAFLLCLTGITAMANTGLRDGMIIKNEMVDGSSLTFNRKEKENPKCTQSFTLKAGEVNQHRMEWDSMPSCEYTITGDDIHNEGVVVDFVNDGTIETISGGSLTVNGGTKPCYENERCGYINIAVVNSSK